MNRSIEHRAWRCWFCRMETRVRLFRIPVCPICRDQLQDFIWVSAVLGSLVAAGVINGLQFAIEEALVFTVLVLVKHRLPSIFDGFVEER